MFWFVLWKKVIFEHGSKLEKGMMYPSQGMIVSWGC